MQWYYSLMQASGFVLAGGRSTRMGRNKALLPFRGMTLLEHVAGIVRDAVGSVTLIGDPAQLGHLGLTAVPDQLPGCGPAGGIYTALAMTNTHWNLIVGCDMPALARDILIALVSRASAAPLAINCIAVAGANGEPEPLCAVYHRRCLAAVARAIGENRLKMKDLVTELGTELMPVDPAAVANVNTPDEWMEFQATVSSDAKPS